jgi:hypothetical protein
MFSEGLFTAWLHSHRLEGLQRWVVASLLCFVCWQPSSLAVDRLFLEAGAANEGDLMRLGAQWELWNRSTSNGKWEFDLELEADLGFWEPDVGDKGLVEGGVTPVFRFAPNRPPSSSLVPFLEAGLGAHLLSNVHFGGLNLSTSLQFGSHIGAGVFIGKNRKISLVYRYQHLSNASVKQPNPGIEFHLLQLGYGFGR